MENGGEKNGEVFLDDINVSKQPFYKSKLFIILAIGILIAIIAIIVIIIILNSSSDSNPEEKTPQIPKTYVKKDEVLILDKDEILETVRLRNVTGEGSIKWSGWKNLTKNGLLTGNLKVKYIDDEIYTSMKLPSEGITFMTGRINPTLFSNQETGYIEAISIGAIYQVLGTTLPKKFNMCIGRMNLYALKSGKNEQWQAIDNITVLNKIGYFQDVTLPWTLPNNVAKPSDKMTVHDNYVEFNFNKTNFVNHTLHFFGKRQKVESEKILGYVTIFEAWTETKEAAGILAAAIGVDVWNATNKNQQEYSGRNYVLGNEKRLIIGHNIPDDLYDKLVDEGKSPKICLELFKKNK